MERLEFKPGVDVEMVEGSQGLLLRAAERRPALVREGVLLVHTGPAPPQYDLRNRAMAGVLCAVN